MDIIAVGIGAIALLIGIYILYIRSNHLGILFIFAGAVGVSLL